MINELNNKEAEEQLVGIILVKPQRLNSIRQLVSIEDFFEQDIKTIYSCIIYLSTNNKPIDIVTVSEQLKFDGYLDDIGGRERINELADNVISTVEYKHLCKIITKYSKKRKLINISNNIEEQLANNIDVDDIAKGVSQDITNLLYNRVNNNLTTLIGGVDEVINEIETVLDSDSKTFGLSTGFGDLDKTISGLCKSRLYIIAARPRVGKSALAQQIAEYVAQNHNVLFHSLEMKHSQYTKRSIFRRCGFNTEFLTRGLVDKDNIFNKVAQSSAELSELRLYIDDTSECTLSTIEKNILTMKETMGGCDLLVVDYAQLMSSDNPRITDRFAIASANSTGLKRLANKYDIPILLLCQLSRGVDNRADKLPTLADLKDSGSYEQDADVVMFIYRGDIYGDISCKGKADLIIAKNREGKCRSIPLLFNDTTAEFRERLL